MMMMMMMNAGAGGGGGDPAAVSKWRGRGGVSTSGESGAAVSRRRRVHSMVEDRRLVAYTRTTTLH